jgi:hypothetical protein
VKVAVVASQHREALEVIARLGMVGKAEPLAAEISPVLGHRFTAVLIVAGGPSTVIEGREWWTGIKDKDWWTDLLGRNSGPIWTLDEWRK